MGNLFTLSQNFSKKLSYILSKRVLDVVISIVVLCTVMTWLIPILVLLIYLDSPGPVFFVQKRVGRNNKYFNCIKLRTMRTKGDTDEERITSMGKWLRNRKLDELPQFINVLRGEMAIVGPRPHMISDHKDFSQAIGSVYHLRHAVLPGITGLAQIEGYEGHIDSWHKLRGRVSLDLFYVRKWSLGLDLKIMWQTASMFINGKEF